MRKHRHAYYIVFPVLFLFIVSSVFSLVAMGDDDVIVMDNEEPATVGEEEIMVGAAGLSEGEPGDVPLFEELPNETLVGAAEAGSGDDSSVDVGEGNGLLVLNKELIGGIWHVGCDVMGDAIWVKDEISNPEGIPSREGHQKKYCGNPDNFVIYLTDSGKPYYMEHRHAGSTGGKDSLPATIYTDSSYETKMTDYSSIKAGERIYFTTENKGQCWHHQGETVAEIPTFTFQVNGTDYLIKAGDDPTEIILPAGTYTVTEKYYQDYIIAGVDGNCLVGTYTQESDGDVSIEVTITEGQKAKLTFTNRHTPPEDPTITPPPETNPETTPETTPPVTPPETNPETTPETTPPEAPPETNPETTPETTPPEAPPETNPETTVETTAPTSGVLGAYDPRETSDDIEKDDNKSGVLGASRSSSRGTEADEEWNISQTSDVPKTADTSPLMPLMILMFAAGAAILVLVYRIRKSV